MCSNFSIPPAQKPFTVYPGDILVACVQDPDSGRLGVAAAVPGAVVLWSGNVLCTSLPTSPIDLSSTPVGAYVALNNTTLHVRLGKCFPPAQRFICIYVLQTSMSAL